MLEGDRLRQFIFVSIAIFNIYFFVNGALNIWAQYELADKTYAENQQRAEEAANKSYAKIAEECQVIAQSNPAFRDCLKEKALAYQKKESAEQDLKAQQHMAFWAMWTFIAGLGSAIVAMLGLLALAYSIFQIRTSINNDREIGHAQVRAYVSVVPGQIEELFEIGKKIPIEFKIRNDGASPAKNLRHIAVVKVLSQVDGQNIGGVVPQKGVTPPSYTLSGPVPFSSMIESDEILTEQDFDSIMSDGDRRLYLFGTVWYDDVFKQGRHTNFCYSTHIITKDVFVEAEFKTLTHQGEMQEAFGIAWERHPHYNDAT